MALFYHAPPTLRKQLIPRIAEVLAAGADQFLGITTIKNKEGARNSRL